MIAHLYVFANLLLGNDSVKRGFREEFYVSNGRWALKFFSSFSGNFQMPVVIGFISIVMISLTAGLTVRILNISHPVSILVISALLVTFPTVACTFAYMYIADAYFIALFVNATAICYAIGLFLFDCIFALTAGKPVKEILKQGGKYVFILIVGLLLYYAVSMFMLSYFDESLSSYMGMEDIGRFDFLSRFAAFPKAYRIFIRYFVRWNFILLYFRPVGSAEEYPPVIHRLIQLFWYPRRVRR